VLRVIVGARLENEIYRELYHNLADTLVLERISKQQRQVDERQQERLDVERNIYLDHIINAKK